MKRYIISLLSIILVFSLIASATSISITIWGTAGNASGAQQNVTKYNANNSVNVSAWNVTKTFQVRSLNASGDTITFNISNNTPWRVYEMKANGTAINGYQASENGMVNFTYAQNNSNVTYSLSPAVNVNGYNMSWIYVWNQTPIPVMSGVYLGTNTANRAVSHGLNRVPNMVFITHVAGSYDYRINPAGGQTNLTWSAANSRGVSSAVTLADKYNFYVGNAADYSYSANSAGQSFYWMAI